MKTEWTDALESLTARTNSQQWRVLCADGHPQAAGWRSRVAAIEAEHAASLAYPPLAEQVGNALKAGLAFVASGFKIVGQAEHDRRLSICRAPCEFWDREQGLCRACGCVDTWKAWVESQQCPKGYWEGKP